MTKFPDLIGITYLFEPYASLSASYIGSYTRLFGSFPRPHRYSIPEHTSGSGSLYRLRYPGPQLCTGSK